MRDFFSLDGPFNKYGTLVFDIIIMSFMWLLFSIIGFGLTIGASTSALFFVSTRRIANREGYITRDFWEAFKANFKKATIVWLMILVVAWLIWFNLTHIGMLGGGMGVIIIPAQLILIVQITFMTVYIFPMIARFDMSMKNALKTSFFMANRHMLTSITCVVLIAAGVIAVMIIPPVALFLAPGLYATLSSYMIMKVFKRYRPEIDKDPMLEVQELEAQRAEERRKQEIGTISESAEKKEARIASPTEPAKQLTIMEKANIPPPQPVEAEEEADIWTKLRQMDPGPPQEKPKKKPKKETTPEDDFWANL